MPCRDYEYDTLFPSSSNAVNVDQLKKQNDRLARIACKAIDALEQNGEILFLPLKDDEVREWYEKHKEEDRKRQAEEERKRKELEEKKRLAEIKRDLLGRLTLDEKKALGIIK